MSTTRSDAELIVVMPTFNEQASIRKVVFEWFEEISNWTEDFGFIVINDGSTDATPDLLNRIQKQLGRRLEVIHQGNVGHGQSCMRGYQIAVERHAQFVLQIDSDGQCDPQYFFRLWRLRELADVVYGVRRRREDGLRRVLVSKILRLQLLLLCGASCADSNSPYRLMRVDRVAPFLSAIGRDFHLANIGLAVILRRAPEVRHRFVPIRFRERYGGEPTVRVSEFRHRAIELARHLRTLPGKGALERIAAESASTSLTTFKRSGELPETASDTSRRDRVVLHRDDP